MSEVTIRPPLLGRVYTVVFSILWCAGVLDAFVVTVAANSAAAAIPVAMLAVGGTLLFRQLRLSVLATTDELIIHNYLSTKRIPKGQIEGFRTGSRTGQNFKKGIVALLRDDTVTDLNVTSRPALTAGGRDKLQTQLAELRDWLEH